MKTIFSLSVFSSFFVSAFFAIALSVGSAHATPSAPAIAGKPAVEKSVAQPAVAKININSADASTIADQLKGIGSKKAEAIVAYRNQHGAFKAVDDLTNVAGIGEATLEKNRSLIDVK